MSTKPFTFPVQPPNVTPPAQNVQPPPCAVPPVAVQVNDKTSTAANHQYAYANNVLTISDGNTPPPPDGIKIGDTVAATVTPTNVRPAPAGNPVSGTVNAGTQGKVVAGPSQANGFAWWQVAFPNNLTGWVGFDSLVVVNPNPPIVVVGAAFPGAMGGGAAAVGGRSASAKVFEVTTLADSGAGSLRAALAASGPRYIVFRTNGLITNKSRMALGNPFCTIAGHTAPGTVCIGGPNQNGEALFISTHDVIAKGLSFDGSNPNLPPGPDGGSVGFELASGLISNVIFDHCSLRWNSNKLFISYANGQTITNITVQNCLMYEPSVGHPVGPMTDASSLAQSCTDQDFLRNVIVNMGHRIPLFNTKSGRWVNNLVFNYDYFALLAQGGVNMDIIGNNYVFGNLNEGNSNPHPFAFSAIQSTDDTTQKMPGPGSFFLQGNICAAYQTDPNGDQTLMCARLNGEGTPEVGPPPASWYRATPLAAQKYPIIALPVAQLDSLVTTAGNSQHLLADGTLAPNNDSQDARVIAQYRAKGSGGQYGGPGYNGPTVAPPITAGTAYPSQYHNGLSDVWVQNHDLDTSDPALWNKISPNAGVPYLECFLYQVQP